jgi:hypothetical protein
MSSVQERRDASEQARGHASSYVINVFHFQTLQRHQDVFSTTLTSGDYVSVLVVTQSDNDTLCQLKAYVI